MSPFPGPNPGTVEYISFTPLVLSATGGMANDFLSSLKWDQSYSSTMFWLCCRLTFSLLCSAIQCIRGPWSNNGHAAKSPPPIDLAKSVVSEIFYYLTLDSFIVHNAPFYTISSLTPYMSVHACRIHWGSHKILSSSS